MGWRVAADCLLLPMAGHVSSEVSREGTRVVAHFPDSISVGKVESIDDGMVKDWACRYPNVGVVVVGGGPPCQGVSGLNSDRKGALKDARRFVESLNPAEEISTGHRFTISWKVLPQ